MKVSFDFDSTLGELRMQKLAAKFIANGDEVFITTSRMDEDWARTKGNPHWNIEVFSVADRLGIKRENIRFTNGADKCTFLKGIDVHFDDDTVEIEQIDSNTPHCCGILIIADLYNR